MVPSPRPRYLQAFAFSGLDMVNVRGMVALILMRSNTAAFAIIVDQMRSPGIIIIAHQLLKILSRPTHKDRKILVEAPPEATAVIGMTIVVAEEAGAIGIVVAPTKGAVHIRHTSSNRNTKLDGHQRH